MIIGSQVKLNLVPSGVMPVVYISQGDAGYDKEFLIYNGDSPYNVPSGVSATIRGTKADGYGVTEAVTVTTGSNLVTVTITEQMVAAAGENVYELVFVDTNDLRVASINMVWAVKPDALGDSVISDSDLDYVSQAMDRIQGADAMRSQMNANTAAISAETAARIAADNTLQSNINTEANTRAATDTSLQAQINQIIAPSGEAPSAAEVQNARIGSNGTVYPTLGDAIRGQINDLKNDFDEISDVTRNLFFGTFSNGNINANNEIDTINNFLHSNEYIPVQGGTGYALSVDATTAFTQIVLLEYSSTKSLIIRRGIRSASSNTHQETVLTTGSTTAFIKLVYYNPSGAMNPVGNKTQLEIGSTVSEYIPHFTAHDIIARDSVDALEKNALTPFSGGQITSASQLASLNDCENNTIYRINVPGGDTPPEGFPFTLKQGLVYTIGWNSDGTKTMIQYCVSLDGLQIAHRVRWGSIWGNWTLESDDPVDFGFIQRFAVVGDSYASGEIYLNSDTPSGYVVADYYDKSWGQILARNYGATCINLSKGGLTTRTWLTDPMGLPLMLSSDPQELYFCALGHNDASGTGYGLSYLGGLTDITSYSSPDDYGDTFFGNYGRIIESIKGHAPNAKIVMMSFAYLYNSTEDAFNNAIKTLAQYYGVAFMDIKTDPFYAANSFYHTGKSWNHPTAPIYAGMAKANAKLFSRTVKKYYDYFKTLVG